MSSLRPAARERAELSLLSRVAALVEPRLPTYVEHFYARLASRSEMAAVVGRLTPAEFAALKSAQVDHLRFLLDPGATPERIATRSRATGRIHALAGVEIDWYADAVGCHQRDLADVLAGIGHAEHAQALSLVTDRLLQDLQGALRGFRDVDLAQSRVLIHLGRTVAEATTVPDLTRVALAALNLLEGVVTVVLGRPGSDGSFVFEAVEGEGVDDLVEWTRRLPRPGAASVDVSSVIASSPMGRAWRSGQICGSDSYLTDPSVAHWRPLAERLGWRSSAAVPLRDHRGRIRAVVSLYAAWPGYFSTGTRAALIDHVRDVLERAFDTLEPRPELTADVQPYDARAAYRERLRRGEVELRFQPVVSLPDGGLLRFEALARLHDGERLIGPVEFLPAFGDEELFRLFEIGLRRSLQALEVWEARGLRVGVAVNMPVLAASDERYLRTVTAALERHPALGPGRLTLELLETGVMAGSLESRQESLRRFKALGVSLAQDDLGAGHSSLLRLRHFDFDVVKIDQSLFRGIEVDPRAALQFVHPIADIAHNLGLHVTLEGLETPGLVDAATQLGVDSGQGYAIGRPMPAAAAIGWAAGFRLDVDPLRPRTALGGLAAHVAWEHRLVAFGSSPARAAFADADTCGLSAYLIAIEDGPDGPRQALHRSLHQQMLEHGRGPGTRAAWTVLTTLLGEG